MATGAGFFLSSTQALQGVPLLASSLPSASDPERCMSSSSLSAAPLPRCLPRQQGRTWPKLSSPLAGWPAPSHKTRCDYTSMGDDTVGRWWLEPVSHSSTSAHAGTYPPCSSRPTGGAFLVSKTHDITELGAGQQQREEEHRLWPRPNAKREKGSPCSLLSCLLLVS